MIAWRSLCMVTMGLALALAPAGRSLASASERFSFSTGSPDGKMGMASRPESPGKIEIEAADDFLLSSETRLDGATFTGLVPAGVALSQIGEVRVEIYRVFPKDSTIPPSGRVPTRNNSPADVEFADRDTANDTLHFTASILASSFTAANTVVNGINQNAGGEGPGTGQEVLFDVKFAPPLRLPPDHYFFIPQVQVAGSGEFLWLSAPKPIVAPGTPLTPDLQTWIRNANLDPDWLRVGTDIVGGSPAPTFNGSFSLRGRTLPRHAGEG
jgi:hypothetical protein